MKSAKEVIDFAKKNNAVMVDLKFIDFLGTWQHFAVSIFDLSEEMLEEHLVDLTLNEEKVRRLGATGHEQFMDKYLLEVCTKRYLDLYESLTPSRKSC